MCFKMVRLLQCMNTIHHSTHGPPVHLSRLNHMGSTLLLPWVTDSSLIPTPTILRRVPSGNSNSLKDDGSNAQSIMRIVNSPAPYSVRRPARCSFSAETLLISGHL